MVYILGTKNREYVLEGVTLPKKAYSDREKELGRKTAVGIDDVVYARLSANKIFQSLVEHGDIIVRDKEPEGNESIPELREKLTSTRDESAKKIAELMAEISRLKSVDAELKSIKAEALTEIEKRDAKIKELEELLDDGK